MRRFQRKRDRSDSLHNGRGDTLDSQETLDQTSTEAIDYRYWAFISYSHSDSAVARKLHRWLESYQIPKTIVGNPAPLGIVPTRLAPVFLDREEASASESLSSVIQSALNQSRLLIVVCSPRSASSRWVNEEIRQFQRLGRAAAVRCFVIDGEPDAVRRGYEPAAECFPPALRQGGREASQGEADWVEPLAADAREQGDGWSDACLRLMSGLIGTGFNSLKQRERIRRRRRWMAIATSAAAVIVSLSFLSVVAIWSSWEAARQRDLAREQVERLYGVNASKSLRENQLQAALPWLLEARDAAPEASDRRQLYDMRLSATLRALPKLLAMRSDNSSPTVVSLSPDGRFGLIGDYASARIFPTAYVNDRQGTEDRVLSGNVRGAVWSNDSAQVMVWLDDKLTRLTMAQKGADLEFARPPHLRQPSFDGFGGWGANQPQSGCVSKDGRWLCVVYWSGHFCVWQTADGSVISNQDTAGLISAEVVATAFSPDHAELLVVRSSGQIQRYRLSDWTVLESLDVPFELEMASFHPDGQLLAVVERSTEQSAPKRIHLYDIGDPQNSLTEPLLTQLQTPFDFNDRPIEFSPAGDHLHINNSGASLLFSVKQTLESKQWSPLTFTTSHRWIAAGFAAGGQQFVGLTRDGYMNVFDLPSSMRPNRFAPLLSSVKHVLPPSEAAISEDGRSILVACSNYADLQPAPAPPVEGEVSQERPATGLESEAYVWQFPDETVPVAVTQPAYGGDASTDDRFMWMEHPDGHCEFYEWIPGSRTLEKGQFLSRFNLGNDLLIGVFIDDATFLSIHFDGVVREWTIARGAATELPYRLHVPADYLCYSAERDSRRLLVGLPDNRLQMFDLKTGELLWEQSISDLNNCEFARDDSTKFYVFRGRLEVDAGPMPMNAMGAMMEQTADMSALVEVRSAATGEVLSSLTPQLRSGEFISSIEVSPNAEFAICAFGRTGGSVALEDNYGSARLFHIPTGKETGKGVQRLARISAISFADDEKSFVVGSQDGIARAYSVATGAPAGPYLEHSSPVVLATTLGPSGLVATMTQDGHVQLWDGVTGDRMTPSWGVPGDFVPVAIRIQGDRLQLAIRRVIPDAVRDLDPENDTPPVYPSTYEVYHVDGTSHTETEQNLSPDGVRPFRGEIYEWALSTLHESPVRQRALIELLSNRRFDGSGGMTELDHEERNQAWTRYRNAD